MTTGDKEANDWDNQFWFRFNEPLLPDAKYRVSFDYRADVAAKASTQAHAEPGNYIHYDMFKRFALSRASTTDVSTSSSRSPE